MQKILRISLLAVNNKGGMEKHILRLTEKQREKGNKVWLLYSQGDCQHENDIQFLKNHNFYNTPLTQYYRVLFYIHILIAFQKTNPIKKEGIDVLHLHGDWIDFLFGYFIKLRLSPKILIASIHGDVVNRSPFKKFILHNILQKFDLVFTTGSENYQDLKRHKIPVIFRPSGIEASFYEPVQYDVEKITRIATVSSLNPNKRIDRVLQIAAQLPQIHFTIVGDGPEKANLVALMQQLKLTNVTFTGNIKKSDIPPLLSNSQLFLFTSDIEGTPTAVLEAMAVGLPIVSTNAGGLNTIVKDSENGFIIFKYNDIQAYVEHILFLRENPKLCQTISENNKKLALQYSWQNAYYEIDKQIELTLKKKQKSTKNLRPKYLIRLDDIAENMNWELFNAFVEKCRQYQIKPILAVIPNNKSEELLIYPPNPAFWKIIYDLYVEGWEIAIHGYDHVYISSDSGLLGINRQSEFAGLSYETQRAKLQNAIEIFKQKSIQPRTFIAPSHSYDQNTIRILEELNIPVISDGYNLYPYRKERLIYIPQLFAKARKMPFGVYTFCYHLNRIDQADFDKLMKFIDKNHQNIIGVDEAFTYTRNGLGNQFLGPVLFSSILKTKRLFSNN